MPPPGRELGATVHGPAFDVMDAGGWRSSTTRRARCSWSGRRRAPSGRSSSTATVCSLERAGELGPGGLGGFYGDLFGWEAESIDAGGMPYMTVKNSDGCTPAVSATRTPVSRRLAVYFGSDDLGASTAEASELGGRVWVPEMDIGMGKIAVARIRTTRRSRCSPGASTTRAHTIRAPLAYAAARVSWRHRPVVGAAPARGRRRSPFRGRARGRRRPDEGDDRRRRGTARSSRR